MTVRCRACGIQWPSVSSEQVMRERRRCPYCGDKRLELVGAEMREDAGVAELATVSMTLVIAVRAALGELERNEGCQLRAATQLALEGALKQWDELQSTEELRTLLRADRRSRD